MINTVAAIEKQIGGASVTAAPIDVDRLPPTQYLILDVLAARHRLGSDLWAFPTSLAHALGVLERAGLVQRMHGNRPRTVRARLTEAGKAAVLSPTYEAPNSGVERPRRALRYIAEYAGERADLVPGMREVAEVARRGLNGGDS